MDDSSGRTVEPADARRDRGVTARGGYTENVTNGRLDLIVRMVYNGDRELAVSGPIRLLAPDGRPMPNAEGRIVDGWTYQLPVEGSETLATVIPGQHVSLVANAIVDCRHDVQLREWPKEYPIVVIPLAGHTLPWSRPLGDLVTFRQGETLYTRACGSAG